VSRCARLPLNQTYRFPHEPQYIPRRDAAPVAGLPGSQPAGQAMQVSSGDRCLKRPNPLPQQPGQRPGQHIASPGRCQRRLREGHDGHLPIRRRYDGVRPFEHQDTVPFRRLLPGQIQAPVDDLLAREAGQARHLARMRRQNRACRQQLPPQLKGAKQIEAVRVDDQGWQATF